MLGNRNASVGALTVTGSTIIAVGNVFERAIIHTTKFSLHNKVQFYE